MLVLQMLADFGLVVLIVMVQHIIYPSFHSVRESSFTDWHKSYTGKIAVVVMPLMLVQIGLSAYSLFYSFSLLAVVHSALVISLWLHTFLIAVPIHDKLDHSKDGFQISKLIRVNWYRTVVWTLVFVVDVIVWMT